MEVSYFPVYIFQLICPPIPLIQLAVSSNTLQRRLGFVQHRPATQRPRSSAKLNVSSLTSCENTLMFDCCQTTETSVEVQYRAECTLQTKVTIRPHTWKLLSHILHCLDVHKRIRITFDEFQKLSEINNCIDFLD